MGHWMLHLGPSIIPGFSPGQAPLHYPAGQELELLADRLPEQHRIVGVDLSEGMVRLAQQRIERRGLWCGPAC